MLSPGVNRRGGLNSWKSLLVALDHNSTNIEAYLAETKRVISKDLSEALGAQGKHVEQILHYWYWY